MNKIKCYICGKPTEFAYRPDIDMEGVPICDPRESDCILELLEKLNKSEVEEEWREKIKNVKYDYPKSENQKEHERNINIIERTVNQIKNQLLQ